MKYVFMILAVIGVLVSALALREHYRESGDSPCSINEKWDCGIVNHSPYAVIRGIPVADVGIAGYLLLGILAFRRNYSILLACAIPALAFSLYLANIEAHVLGVWCVYCAASLANISIMTVLALIIVLAGALGKPRPAAAKQA